MSLTNKKSRSDSPENENSPVPHFTTDDDALVFGQLNDDAQKVEESHHFLIATVPEVWLNVFEKLNPEDKPAFSRACPQFHAWLEPRRNCFLLYEVAPILLEKVSKQILLESRKICRFWSQATDHQYRERRSDPLRLVEDPRPPVYTNRFHSTESMQKFMVEMENHPGNPFPWGNLQFQWNPPDDWRQQPEFDKISHCRTYWTLVLSILRKFGSEVEYCRLIIGDSSILVEEMAEFLRNILPNLPKLKRLAICGGSGQIQNPYRGIKLPLLPKLEVVNARYADWDLISAILNACVPSNVKRLSFENTQLGGRVELPEPVYGFSNLEFLKAPISVRDLQRLGTSTPVPPLKEVDCQFENSRVSFEEVFTALGSFSTSLIHVAASMLAANGEVGTRISLPNLRKLHIRFYQGTFEPILQLKGLTHLKITSCRRLRREDMAREPPINVGEDSVQFYGFERKMYESNIWRLMSSLQTLRIGNDQYERHILNLRNHSCQSQINLNE
ncbi:hypothetical protein Ocin01_15950 [Orchesella cincta]|uniref:F-box domain-containing protein n=1 Tax=Orchesella cincta TaxID=48709 RepID=A0A1D2MCX3_ORCCI|nr:hypothetical protein Ocin01_15950 [Orchesella cincta]